MLYIIGGVARGSRGHHPPVEKVDAQETAIKSIIFEIANKTALLYQEKGASLFSKRMFPRYLRSVIKKFSVVHSLLTPVTLSFFIADGTSILDMTGGYNLCIFLITGYSQGHTLFYPSSLAPPCFAPSRCTWLHHYI